MNNHIEDILVGGRPMTKLERANKEIERLNRIIKIMENYLELIYDLGYDQDGCKTTGDLISLIDELVRYASLGRAYNTTAPIFASGNRKFNILNEELGENDVKENN